MQNTLSPEEAVSELQSGTHPMEVLAQIDLEECHFMPEVNSQRPPVVTTGISGFGGPVRGVLAFTQEEVDDLIHENKTPILVHGGNTNTININNGAEIIASDVRNPTGWVDTHLLARTASRNALLDNPAHPVLKLDSKRQELALNKHITLHYGDEVTIDPEIGALWKGSLSITPAPDCRRPIQLAIHTAFNALSHKPIINFALTSTAELQAIQNHFWSLFERSTPLQQVQDLTLDCDVTTRIGLRRTENSLRKCLAADEASPTDILTQFAAGDKPQALENWEFPLLNRKNRITGYRLVDLSGLTDLLPSAIAKSMDDGELSQPNSAAWNFRSALYDHQLTNVFNGWMGDTRQFQELLDDTTGKNLQNSTKNIIIPAITSNEEVRIFRSLFDQKLNIISIFHPAKFGVMIETAGALREMGEIARSCDILCIGGNDLTAALTGLSRSQLDHSEWMQERGLKGRSPFEVLVPEVLEPLREGIKAARQANPDIKISFCGHQIAGHSLSSINACLDLGVDILTIPPTGHALVQTRAMVVQRAARQAFPA